jgi:hypothetical protein
MLLTRAKKQNNNPFFVTPREFLDWAKKDLETNDRRSIGNAIGNIKKAIHCRIDEIIDCTHIKYCKDWNPRANTNTKLEALKIFNIKYTAVVSLLTEMRNNYEHKYKLPDYEQAQAYLETAEMWLDNSYERYSFNSIGIVKLKTKQFGVLGNANGTKLSNCIFEKNSDLDYLWDSKRQIHEIRNGNLTIRSMDTVEWKTMARYEAKYLVDTNQFNLPARLLTSLYRKAQKELLKK